MKDKKILRWLIATMLLFFLAGRAWSRPEENQTREKEHSISAWLLLGPFSTPLPAFHDEEKKEYSLKDFLLFESLDLSSLKPRADASFKLPTGVIIQWKTVAAGDRGIELARGSNSSSTAYLGAYIDVRRWMKANITLQSSQLLNVYLDGKVVASKSSIEKAAEGKPSNGGKKVSGDLILETGKHLLLVKTVFDPESGADWTIQATLSYNERYAPPEPVLTLSSHEWMTIKHLLDGPKVTGASISADGSLAAVSKSQSLPPGDESEAWVEIYDLAGSRLMHTYRGDMAISQVNWAPQGKIFSYTSRDKEGGTIWIVDLEKGTSVPLLKKVKNLGGHTWSPDGSFLVYSVSEEGPKDQKGVKRFQNLADRQPGWRSRSYLYKITMAGRIIQKMTAGELSTPLQSIHPDGKSVLFVRTIIDYSERPFSITELYTLDLTSLDTKLLWKGKWFSRADWSPDGKRILVLGGPSTFGAAGVHVPEGTVPNELDTQVFIFDPLTGTAEPISKNFNPSIDAAIWSQSEDCIYFLAIDRSYRHLFRYDLKKKAFAMVDSGVEVIERIAIARNKPLAVFTGSSANIPPKAYFLNMPRQKTEILDDPGKDDFSDVTFGEVRRWTFKNRRGRYIEGRVYYPPDFDRSKKYPCIVYYYGGTSPVTREFGGRYPKNLYAANGYVVYVMQPSGATGFGQDFSALHVNDWGLIVADEIIDGVKKFLEAHPFVDARRIGCMGASYGGFMTMAILTRTNIFSAAVAHAGISSISSYWGEGYWGYWYNAYAAANSFPWNRKDIYVNQSPLFSADKISTPLLLLHGSEDTNVPPGESTQLFTALKILGREVEYIQILDQNHHIMNYTKRIIWTKTILSWFDNWLKGQPEWWSGLYPDR